MTASGYLGTVADFYERVADTPEVGLCCIGGGQLALHGLCVTPEMEAMSYGCGSSVQPQDLGDAPRVVYVGVGGGKEALQFAFFAFALPVEDASVDVVAQNCLFNIFEPDDLSRALRETRRVLRRGGRLSMSDPIATRPIPSHRQDDARLGSRPDIVTTPPTWHYTGGGCC